MGERRGLPQARVSADEPDEQGRPGDALHDSAEIALGHLSELPELERRAENDAVLGPHEHRVASRKGTLTPRELAMARRVGAGLVLLVVFGLAALMIALFAPKPSPSHGVPNTERAPLTSPQVH
jgi:hypothetical protein